MANYLTKSSFYLQCSDDQAILALKAHNALKNYDHTLERIFELELHGVTHSSMAEKYLDRLILRSLENHPEYPYPEYPIQQERLWDFQLSKLPHGLWFRHEATLNIEEAACFTQSILNIFDISIPVQINYANVCDEPLRDAFGGGLIVVAANYLETFSYN